MVFAQDNPDLSSYSFLTIICANAGDEELQPEMERFLLSLRTRNANYAICELGNYFGFERDCFGCKKIVRRVLKQLAWRELEHISIDSLPTLDKISAIAWVNKLVEKYGA